MEELRIEGPMLIPSKGGCYQYRFRAMRDGKLRTFYRSTGCTSIREAERAQETIYDAVWYELYGQSLEAPKSLLGRFTAWLWRKFSR